MRLQFQASYGARSISAKEKKLFLLSLLEGEPSILCARFVRHNIDDMTYETHWEVLDQRYCGQIREDQQVMEEFVKVKVLESMDQEINQRKMPPWSSRTISQPIYRHTRQASSSHQSGQIRSGTGQELHPQNSPQEQPTHLPETIQLTRGSHPIY